jgi:hypothetical protein
MSGTGKQARQSTRYLARIEARISAALADGQGRTRAALHEQLGIPTSAAPLVGIALRRLAAAGEITRGPAVAPGAGHVYTAVTGVGCRVEGSDGLLPPPATLHPPLYGGPS